MHSDPAFWVLALLRPSAGALPLRFTLDDSMGMAGGPKLSQVASVIDEARVSKSGNAMPQPGDLDARSAPVAPGTHDVRAMIDHVVS